MNFAAELVDRIVEGKEVNNFSEKASQVLTENVINISQKTVGIAGDFVGAIVGGLALLPAAYNRWKKIDYDPETIIIGKTPILLIHGKAYNQTEWLIGRRYLNNLSKQHGLNQGIGSIFSVDYDGLCSNDESKTIEDYARTVIRDKILEICKKTETNKIILIGHSLGGLIASSFAEDFSDGIEVVRIITIATPWKEPPLLKYVNKLRRQVLNEQMMENNLAIMRMKAKRNLDRYRSFGSFGDVLVSNENATLSEEIHTSYNWCGHQTIVIYPNMWNDVYPLLIS